MQTIYSRGGEQDFLVVGNHAQRQNYTGLGWISRFRVLWHTLVKGMPRNICNSSKEDQSAQPCHKSYRVRQTRRQRNLSCPPSLLVKIPGGQQVFCPLLLLVTSTLGRKGRWTLGSSTGQQDGQKTRSFRRNCVKPFLL